MKMALLFGVIAGLLCATDPIVGTWKLNLAKSKYSPGPPPNAVTLTYEETADGTLKMREILDVGGTITRPQYDAKFDQKEYHRQGCRNGCLMDVHANVLLAVHESAPFVGWR